MERNGGGKRVAANGRNNNRCIRRTLGPSGCGGNDGLAAIDDILRVGTSAGGARAKTILAWNPNSGEFRHGQIDAGVGFEHWLMKLDGIENNRDKDKPDPQGYGLIEYAYFLMAKDAGVEMMPCRQGWQNTQASHAVALRLAAL